MVALGYSDDRIAERLDVSTDIVRKHVSDILKVLDVPDRASAALAGLRLGLID